MRIIIEVETDNAAFENNPNELRGILIGIAEKVALGVVEGRARDTNGNTVGKWEVQS